MGQNIAQILRPFVDDRKNSSTQFDTVVSDGTSSLLDLPSTYPFNSERYERLTEGTVDDTDFEDADGEFSLSVNGTEGDAHELRARQRLTYLPNYELLWGAAFYMQDVLEPGQRLTVSLTSPDRTNAYAVELEHDSRRSYISSGGVEVDSADWGERENTTDPYSGSFDETQPQVVREFLSWYGDGAARTTLTHADAEARVQNPEIARVANRESVATEEINLQISVRLECTAATDAATVNVLSFGALIRGDSSQTNRTKPALKWDLGGDINATEFTPILALRRIPGKEQIPTELDRFEIVPTDTMEVTANAYPADDVTIDETMWDVPAQQDPENTAIEQNDGGDDPFTVPTDAEGNPTARLLDLVFADAQGSRTERAAADESAEFFEDEIVVFMARTKSASNASVDLAWWGAEGW